MRFSAIFVASMAAPLAQALVPRSIAGMKQIWHEPFTGCYGCSPNTDRWNVALHIDTNDEAQVYTDSHSNLRLSGGDTLELIPTKNSKGDWTSGRIETKDAWAAKPGKKLRYQARMRLGDNLQKKGLWPAFWMLGDAVRHGTQWPLCGELDIFEQINGDKEAYGTVHCKQPDGGPCQEPTGLRETTPLADNDYHDWSLVVDRTASSWHTESIHWLKDGESFHTLTGDDVGDEAIWATLAHSPFYIILNVAVGGAFPGAANDATEDGLGSMMEVEYVAVFESD